MRANPPSPSIASTIISLSAKPAHYLIPSCIGGCGRSCEAVMLLLSRSEIASLLDLPDYLKAVEEAFLRHAQGRAFEPALAHVDADGGEFHIKAGGLEGDPPYFALKVNGGFFQNQKRFGLPNIQGLIVLSRA